MTPLPLSLQQITEIQEHFSLNKKKKRKIKIYSFISPLFLIIQPILMLPDDFEIITKIYFGLIPYFLCFYAFSKTFEQDINRNSIPILDELSTKIKISKNGDEFNYISDYNINNKFKLFEITNGRRPLKIEVKLDREKHNRKSNRYK